MDDFYVVETEHEIYLGMVEFEYGVVVIYTGYPGHPKRIYAPDITSMYPAHWHPAVVSLKAS